MNPQDQNSTTNNPASPDASLGRPTAVPPATGAVATPAAPTQVPPITVQTPTAPIAPVQPVAPVVQSDGGENK